MRKLINLISLICLMSVLADAKETTFYVKPDRKLQPVYTVRVMVVQEKGAPLIPGEALTCRIEERRTPITLPTGDKSEVKQTIFKCNDDRQFVLTGVEFTAN